MARPTRADRSAHVDWRVHPRPGRTRWPSRNQMRRTARLDLRWMVPRKIPPRHSTQPQNNAGKIEVCLPTSQTAELSDRSMPINDHRFSVSNRPRLVALRSTANTKSHYVGRRGWNMEGHLHQQPQMHEPEESRDPPEPFLGYLCFTLFRDELVDISKSISLNSGPRLTPSFSGFSGERHLQLCTVQLSQMQTIAVSAFRKVIYCDHSGA